MPTCNCLAKSDGPSAWLIKSQSLEVSNGDTEVLEAEAATAVVETGTPDGPATEESGGESDGDTLTGGEFPPSSEELETVTVSRGGRKCAPLWFR